MSASLRELLDAKEPLFSLAIKQLEEASGREGYDVRLAAEITHKMRSCILALGLDPDDTTGPELYAALMVKIQADNARLAGLVGCTDPDDIHEAIPKLVELIRKSQISRSCWVLKRSVAKRLLKRMPPKQLMKHLGYRSIDSMLKRENIDEIYTAIRFSEGDTWLNAYNELLRTIVPSDFETREISLIVMDKKYTDLARSFTEKKRHYITHTKEMGTVVVLPAKQQKVKGITLTSLALLLHYINEVQLYSVFFKLKQVLPHFGEVVVETLIADPAAAAQIAGQPIHWRVIQRYFGKLKDAENHPEIFEPHVQPEDLHWRKAEELLAEIDPDMTFWVGQEYVAKLFDGRPLSFNLIDTALSYSNGELYHTFYNFHFRESLWNELFSRYMGVQNLRNQVLRQLNNHSVAPEMLKV